MYLLVDMHFIIRNMYLMSNTLSLQLFKLKLSLKLELKLYKIN